MDYSLYITDTANESLDEIVYYMVHKLKNPLAATNFLNEIQKKYEKVCKNPEMYECVRDRRLALKGYRKIPVDNYVIIYLINDEKREIEIRDVFYCGEDYKRYL